MPEWISKYWIEWVFGLIAAFLAWMVKRLSGRIKREQEENKALRDGIRALLKVSIENECQRCQREHWCGPVKRATITDMYASYKALGGNSGTTSIVEQTLDLPAVEPEKGEHNHD
ncbi:MAG: hypothetical protein IKS31_04810 [Clostridia bacterium]|nr:hypothetical protein [Clostridia bacterium]